MCIHGLSNYLVDVVSWGFGLGLSLDHRIFLFQVNDLATHVSNMSTDDAKGAIGGCENEDTLPESNETETRKISKAQKRRVGLGFNNGLEGKPESFVKL